MNNSAQIYSDVTDSIIKALESGQTGKWKSPFAQLVSDGFPINTASEKYYSGINILNLWSAGINNGFSSAEWGTFKQWKAKGHSVLKGQKSVAKVIFYKPLKIRDKDSGEEKSIPMIKAYAVFNREQTDAPQIATESPTANENETLCQGFEAFVKSTGAQLVSVEQNKAYYSPASDQINIPQLSNMVSASAYQSTLAHELVHWTGHKSRLDRFGETSKAAYAFEELIAELGAAFVCARLGISQDEIPNHVNYLASWLKALKNDNKYIFRASAQAEKAANYLNPQ